MLEEEDGFLGPAKADPLPWDVLDNGADQTGAQMQLLMPFISGQVRLASSAFAPLRRCAPVQGCSRHVGASSAVLMPTCDLQAERHAGRGTAVLTLRTNAAQITGFNINFFNASDFVFPAPNTSFVFGPPGKRLPFPDQTFDVVISMNVLEHVAGACVRSATLCLPCSRV